MTQTAVFYTLSTVAQVLAALVALSAVFVVFWNQMLQRVLDEHSKPVSKILGPSDGLQWVSGLMSGEKSLSEFNARLRIVQEDGLPRLGTESMIQAAISISIYGAHQRRMLARFKQALVVNLSTIAASVLLLPVGEWVAAHAFIAWIPVVAAMLGLLLIGDVLRMSSGPEIDIAKLAENFR